MNVEIGPDSACVTGDYLLATIGRESSVVKINEVSICPALEILQMQMPICNFKTYTRGEKCRHFFAKIISINK